MNSLIIFSKCIQLCTHHINPVLEHGHHPLKLLVPTAVISMPSQAQASLPIMKYLYSSLFGQICSGSCVSMRQLVIQTQGQNYRIIGSHKDTQGMEIDWRGSCATQEVPFSGFKNHV